MNCRVFHVRTYFSACNCARGCTDKVDSERKILCRTGKSNLPQRRGGPTLYQPSHVAMRTDKYIQKGEIEKDGKPVTVEWVDLDVWSTARHPHKIPKVSSANTQCKTVPVMKKDTVKSTTSVQTQTSNKTYVHRHQNQNFEGLVAT